MTKKYELLSVGNAIIDIIVNVEDQFLIDQKLEKSAMTLIDAQQTAKLYSKVDEAIEKSGGSAANTAIGFGKFGGNVNYIGTIAKDQFGTIFHHDMNAANVDYSPIYIDDKPTSQSIILVTPDGERTMNTFLGASTDLGPEHIVKEQILAAKVVYFEGYLWYQPPARKAFGLIADMVKDTDIKIAVSLADQFCVDNFRDDFKSLIADGTIEILFGNDDEIKALYQTNNFDDAMAANAKTDVLSFITRGAQGAVAQKGDKMTAVAVEPVSNIVDLSGAGDVFAAGVLYGLSIDLSHEDSTKLGCMAAREVIQTLGPHPQVDILKLGQQVGLLK